MNKNIRLISRFLSFVLVVITVIGLQPAYASWETGIIVSPKSDSASGTNMDAKAAATYTAKVLELVNDERTEAGLTALKPLDTISSAATTRAKEASSVFKHTRPDGRSCATIYADFGLLYSAAGENLAYGYAEPDALVNAWMDSKAHCENILNGDFKYAEVGYFINDRGVIYCALLLYTP